MSKSNSCLNRSARVIVGSLILVAMGCARTQAYKESQEYPPADNQSYYGDPQTKKTPTQRISEMGQPKKRAVVFNFWNDTPLNLKGIGDFAADELRRGLLSSERVLITNEAQRLLETEDYVQMGPGGQGGVNDRGPRVRVAQLIREGQKQGVALVVIGRISRVVYRQRGDEVGLFRQKQSLAAADVEIKVFDVAGGREIMASSRSGEASTSSMVALEPDAIHQPKYRFELASLAVREAVSQLIPDVLKSVEKMQWEGKVAKVLGSKIYINAGRASGLVPGDILRVLTQGDEIFDHDSGALLGKTPGQLKGTLEVVDFIGDDAAITSTHTGGQFQEGDTVRLY